ncbi:hypothetical protein BDZ45DRAFT_749089 [Acephala macrosclerotiorum]|nr:hypothetical protein BDZ45DRAFT_749089 [Acephala macrosclerotiorum]
MTSATVSETIERGIMDTIRPDKELYVLEHCEHALTPSRRGTQEHDGFVGARSCEKEEIYTVDLMSKKLTEYYLLLTSSIERVTRESQLLWIHFLPTSHVLSYSTDHNLRYTPSVFPS